jgi:FAD dependent oxidoreductase TIGR03364
MVISGKADVAIVGSGIVGIALASAWARRGKKVLILEREERPVGASIRNFGLVWPMGQPSGKLWQRALKSRERWLEYSKLAGFSAQPTGSLHLAHQELEVAVLREFLERAEPHGFAGAWLDQKGVAAKSPAVKSNGLLGGLWSPHEVTVDGREALPAMLKWLARERSVQVVTDASVNRIEQPRVVSAQGVWEADSELRILYPEILRKAGITNCKLQMWRTHPQPNSWKLGPALCAGLTLLHYAAFTECPSLGALRAAFSESHPAYIENGIHVLVSQNGKGEVILGDTHHYGLTHDPFLYEELDARVREYLDGFANLPDPRVAQRWMGVYPKLSGATEFIAHPEPGVTIVNALGGAGMTLSFGLAEELAEL